MEINPQTWSGWVGHRNCWLEANFPDQPGLYKIRAIGSREPIYIGQTGGSLRKRMRALASVYRDEMPYAAPHTAGPGLWALRRNALDFFEVATRVVKDPHHVRIGLEAAELAKHRQFFGSSPALNFGRIPLGFRKSSNVSSKLLAAGKQFRGGLSSELSPHHSESIPPVGDLSGDVDAPTWCGHHWSDWARFDITNIANSPATDGLYRIQAVGHGSCLIYVGEGRICSRLKDHLKEASSEKESRKYAHFARETLLEFSVVTNSQWTKNQRVELEHDLIGAHVISTGLAPIAQFGGG